MLLRLRYAADVDAAIYMSRVYATLMFLPLLILLPLPPFYYDADVDDDADARHTPSIVLRRLLLPILRQLRLCR